MDDLYYKKYLKYKSKYNRLVGGYNKEIRVLTWNILAPGWFYPYQDVTYGLNYSHRDNIWTHEKFHDMRLANIIKTIKNVNPDIVCVQEIDFHSLDQILKNTNYLSTPISLNYNIANEGGTTLYNPEKIELLSTVGFISKNEPNIYTHIKVKKTGKEYAILNVHLPRGGECAKALEEAINLNKEVKKYVDNTELPFIICGDFNSSNRMTEELHKQYKNYYWSKPTVNEYKEYTQLLQNKGIVDSINTLANKEQLYTTVKETGVTDHEDHIYIRENMKCKIYYGDYLDKELDEKITDQGENGLLYFTQKNQERPNWDKIYNQLTSDHRWICIDIL